MKQFLLLIALGAGACGRGERQSVAEPTPSNVEVPTAPASQPQAVVPMPDDQAELDRMILAGYTPHGSHLHRPGVKECPLSQGSQAVM